MSPARANPASASGGAGAPARLFAALGDPTRLEAVARLCREGPVSTSRLAAGASITRQAIAKHMGVLSRAGLVRGRKRGRERLWELDRRRLELAREYLEVVSHRWDATLARLKAAVES